MQGPDQAEEAGDSGLLSDLYSLLRCWAFLNAVGPPEDHGQDAKAVVWISLLHGRSWAQ